MLWWEKHPARLMEEARKMERKTNSEMLLLDGSVLSGRPISGSALAWRETITSNSGRRYTILIACQQNHPFSAPLAWILEPKIAGCHHMFSNGRLCLHDYSIGPHMTWVLNIRNWACEWVDCYEKNDWRTF
jgi:hypothetical protein